MRCAVNMACFVLWGLSRALMKARSESSLLVKHMAKDRLKFDLITV